MWRCRRRAHHDLMTTIFEGGGRGGSLIARAIAAASCCMEERVVLELFIVGGFGGDLTNGIDLWLVRTKNRDMWFKLWKPESCLSTTTLTGSVARKSNYSKGSNTYSITTLTPLPPRCESIDRDNNNTNTQHDGLTAGNPAWHLVCIHRRDRNLKSVVICHFWFSFSTKVLFYFHPF